jgi:hypothetical protein
MIHDKRSVVSLQNRLTLAIESQKDLLVIG